MSVSMKKVMEKLEERKWNLKVKLWDSLTDEQLEKIFRTATENQRRLLDLLEDTENFGLLLEKGEWPALIENELVEEE